MALLVLSKGQLLLNIYKMCHENDIMNFYKKEFVKYDVEKLATEYLKIEKEIENKIEKEKNMQMQKNDYIDLPECDEIVLAKPK